MGDEGDKAAPKKAPDVKKASKAKPTPHKGPGVDATGAAAHVIFLMVGGLLVYGLADAIEPAAKQHLGAACRPLNPEPRSGMAPDKVLKDLDGNDVSLADFRGKFVVLNFWGTFCDPCTEEWPALDTLAERFSERDDVVILAVSMDPEEKDIAPFLERMSLTESRVKVLWDPEQDFNKKFESNLLPDTFFVDQDGELRKAFINVRPWGRPQAFRCVDAMARGIGS